MTARETGGKAKDSWVRVSLPRVCPMPSWEALGDASATNRLWILSAIINNIRKQWAGSRTTQGNGRGRILEITTIATPNGSPKRLLV